MKNLIIPKVRLKISKFIDKILLGNIVGNIPYTIINDIKEIIDNEEYKNKFFLYRKLDNSYIEQYKFPENYPVIFPQEKAYFPKYIYKIKNGFFSPRTGVVWSKDKIFLESVGSLNRLIGWGDILPDLLMNKSKNIIEDSVIICPDTGYFHWLLEVLPNILHLLKNIEDDIKIVISRNSNKYIIRALKVLFKNKFKERVISIERPIKAKTIYFASYENQSGFVRKIDRNILKECFLSNKIQEKTRKIYISRTKADRRKLGNEIEIEKMLKNIGFDVIYAEDLDWIEQIDVFNSAEFIVAPHGAGLANIVWCQRDTKILEIFPYNKLHFCYATLALANNLKYDYIICKKDNRSSGIVDLKFLENKILSNL